MSCALVIDDEETLLESIREAASLRQLHVDTAATWEEGLDLFLALSPNLVIADYNLEGSRDGMELLVRIKRLRPSVKLILVSGFLDEKDMEAVRALGLIDRALTKGSVMKTARAIIDEVAAAADRVVVTDWVGHASAYVEAGSVSQEDLDKLDALLRDRHGA